MKRLNYILFTFIIFLGFNLSVNAGGGSLSVSNSNVTVGSSFTASANLYSVAAWNVKISASGPVSGCSLSAADSSTSATNVSKTISVKCRATGTGNITVSLSGDVTSADGNNTSISGTKTVNVTNANNTTKKEVFLKSLSVDGYEISPSFDETTLEYSLSLNSDVTKIKINAEASIEGASIEGIGEKEVSKGDNKFEIVVKKDNSSKIYVLNVNVDENPVNVKVNGKSYSVIKKKEEMPELTIEHEDLTLTINDIEVSAYRIDKINYVLLGLKDSKGTIKLYRFQSFKNDNKKFIYTPFIYFEDGKNQIVYLDMPKSKIPENYKKYKIKINDEEVFVYKLSKDSKYSLLYGINAQTGKKNIYKYEKSENTFQIYDQKEINYYKNIIKEFEIIIFIFLVTAIIIMFIKLIQIISYKKKRKRRRLNK